jgi:hypothetical protein
VRNTSHYYEEDKRYFIIVKDHPRGVEFINRNWYFIHWSHGKECWTENPSQDQINNPRIYQLGTRNLPWGQQPEPESEEDKPGGIRTPTTSSGPKSALPDHSPIQEFLPEETEELTCQVQGLIVQNPTTSSQTIVSTLTSLLPLETTPKAIQPPRHYLHPLSTGPDIKGKQKMSGTQIIATTTAGSGSIQIQQPPPLPPGAPGGGGPTPGGGGPAPGGGGHPPGGGGPPGGSGGPPGGGAGPAGAAPAAPQAAGGQNRALKGIPPKTYGGKQGEAEAFLQHFKLYRNANRMHHTMTNPFEQTNFMLTFCKGNAINEWAAQQGDLIHNWVEGNIAQGLYPTRLDTDETIWTDTEQVLLDTFREYHKGETAHRELKKLRQEPGQVEDCHHQGMMLRL